MTEGRSGDEVAMLEATGVGKVGTRYVPGLDIPVLSPATAPAAQVSAARDRGAFLDAATEALLAGHRKLVLDLTAYALWDSEAVATLVAVNRLVGASEGTAAFVIPERRLRLFEIVGLDRVCRLFTTVNVAVLSV